jgi:L-fuconolactonase
VTIIDIHPHVVSKDVLRYPYNPIADLTGWVVERPHDVDEYLAAMDRAGIAKAVLVHPSSAYSYDNSYAADAAAAHADRLRFVGAIEVTAPDAAATIRRLVRERGMAGFRIYAQSSRTGEGAGEWLADPATFPAWEAARELGITVCVQTRYPSFDKLESMLRRFSSVKVIIDHGGYPPTDDGPPYAKAHRLFELAQNNPNFHFKLSERNWTLLTAGKADATSFVQKLIAAFGVNRIAWGSNFPSSPGSLEDLVALAQDRLAFLPEADRESIFSGTACTLYPSIAV